jgi:hypothetical protein
VAKHETVEEYIQALPEPLAEVADAARHVIDANLDGAESAIKWRTRRGVSASRRCAT